MIFFDDYFEDDDDLEPPYVPEEYWDYDYDEDDFLDDEDEDCWDEFDDEWDDENDLGY